MPDWLRIEYMLRYHHKALIDRIFPYVPVDDMKALIFHRAGVRYKDEQTIDKLFHHLKT